MNERTTVRLPEELLRRAKRKAVSEGVTLTALIEEGLRRVLNERRAPSKSERILPPVCSVSGGAVPGVDITNSAQLQEMEDLEYVERMRRMKIF